MRINKVLIANRGEIAMRIMRTCRVMNIPSVGIYTHVDRNARHVRYANESYCISDNIEDVSYLKADKIIEIAKKTGAAIHPGYGFYSENPEFAERCEKEGVIFIGPSSKLIRMMGNKTAARKTMIKAGLPVVPGTEEPLNTAEEVKRIAREVGYPIMLKAAAGGGGKGMRRVDSEAEIDSAWRAATSEALNAFGDGSVYVEKYILEPHHIEVQVLGDQHGNLIHMYERECSIQRRHQKVIEESPSPFLRQDVREKMLALSVEACKNIGYYSAGTLEFIVDKDQNFYFLEMNTRLQVEHLVTEMCTGVDLVRDMIIVASGEKLPYAQSGLQHRGAAMECRIYAEDPENNFMPCPGLITVHDTPEGRNVRVDSGASQGYVVPIYYDPMISKVCSWGRNRESTILNMVRALREYKIMGIKTTIKFHLRVLHNPTFLSGNYDTTFIDTNFDKEDLKRRRNNDPTVAVIGAAIEQYLRERDAAARATTMPAIGEAPWKHYGKLQKIANRF
ncbi:MAG: acetyl-CoA carboxylase biotin carboxylase subunit [Deferribacteraceae bacterium]|jgi:acetyl-CoA carboxylase biotin carboxylase subunit|nr:acetyl-CoA carboxylase biotin carboxylase subunit [Deferribacteraceae bacterium]